MTELTTAWMLGCVCGFFMGVTVASRRPTCRELMRDRDHQPSFAELFLSTPHDRNIDWRRRINHDNTQLRDRDTGATSTNPAPKGVRPTHHPATHD